MRKVLFILLLVISLPSLGQVPLHVNVNIRGDSLAGVFLRFQVMQDSNRVFYQEVDFLAQKITFPAWLPDAGTYTLLIDWNSHDSSVESVPHGERHFLLSGTEKRVEMHLQFEHGEGGIFSNHHVDRIFAAPDSLFSLVLLGEPVVGGMPFYRIENHSRMTVGGYPYHGHFWGNFYQRVPQGPGQDSVWVKRDLGEWCLSQKAEKPLKPGQSVRSFVPVWKEQDGRIRWPGRYEYRVLLNAVNFGKWSFSATGARFRSKDLILYELVHAFEVE